MKTKVCRCNLDTCKKAAALLWKRPWQLQITKEGNRQELLRITNRSVIFQFVLSNFYLGQQRQTLMTEDIISDLSDLERLGGTHFVLSRALSLHNMKVATLETECCLWLVPLYIILLWEKRMWNKIQQCSPSICSQRKECLYKPHSGVSHISSQFGWWISAAAGHEAAWTATLTCAAKAGSYS